MEVVGGASLTDTPGSRAGLVLLYAPRFDVYQPAYALDPSQESPVIGRDSTAAIQIADSSVSRRHARIERRDDRWFVVDLGGKNGTIVDGVYIVERALEPLHEIRIGDAVFKFVESGAEHYARHRIDGVVLGEDAPKPVTRSPLIGGYQMSRVLSTVSRVAKTNMSVLLLGETGTGKEVVARLIHDLSGRRGPFIAVNCAAIPPTLVESELFGVRKGAFSGAAHDKVGIIESAHGGTLFLDEIGDLPLESQAKLLRVLQTHEVTALGSSVARTIDLRVISATHCDLTRLRSENRFRDDLFARINEFSLVLPPLRERKEDIYALTKAFLGRHDGAHLHPNFPFMVGLLHHDWPLNVRELESYIKRAIALAEGPVLTAEQLPTEIRDIMLEYAKRGAPLGPKAPASSKAPTADELRTLFKVRCGNLAAVARDLGCERMQVHRWAKRYGIVIDEYR
ncbi:MAG: sigma-54-dependent Fis family transcriptional regulator [Polyangiaceae bacterium]|nr:sigma-54-dependent Fis family transcriptional regulator [Polyangiaceae bacterium]